MPFKIFVNILYYILEAMTENEANLAVQEKDTPI